ncbi:ParB/RepB/Spo0J family partition protein [Paenibacillus thalictri]|uniref:ParB/RepB/Spo0J family partition protein n=1 Tax=Paenibacillus thalictri TaxID=2527873 RepID=A0A4Q9DHY0_9BACL|nr:ParB/RepB/Spo0J family partition protein [Paenibacillus thalictri]TBL71586.1 ParB/RepB/Spo0J family partition protein [Paenibacillus thalictri]
MEIINIPLKLIDEDTDQPRYQFDEDSLQELMKSIEELGLLSPIKVRTVQGGRYKIIYGNRRYKASSMLGRETIPCIVSTATDDMEIYLEQIAENLTREGFSPIEEAEAFHKLLHDSKFSSSVKYLSSKLGKPESYIKNKCDLLKFGNAVKKLIVSGVEIRKDKLTEDQLQPLKDLPLEHRDPLALIVARDELPVSDVKKIARLFKDKDISDNTKGKLLYKSGRELIETWSVFEHNRAERAKAAKAQAEAAAEAEKAKKASAEATAASGTAASPAAPPAGVQAAQATGVQAAAPAIAAAPAAAASPAAAATAAAAPPAASIEDQLRHMLAAVPTHQPLPAEMFQSALGDTPSFEHGVDALIENLEKHLAEWKRVRELVGK